MYSGSLFALVRPRPHRLARTDPDAADDGVLPAAAGLRGGGSGGAAAVVVALDEEEATWN